MVSLPGVLRRDQPAAELGEPTSGPPTVAILYVGSRGRSGSTLLDRMLSQITGLTGGGEIRLVWSWGVRANLPCGCGAPFLGCPFWSAVGERAFDGWSRSLADEVLALERSLKRIRYLPFLLSGKTPRGYRARHHRYGELQLQLYRAIATVSAADVVIDSSKDPAHAALLARTPGFTVGVVHLVRDSRAVVHSWRKAFQRPDVGARAMEMPRDSLPGAIVRYVIYNALYELLPLADIPRVLVRYESLVTDPRRELKRILALLGRSVAEEDFSFLGDRDADLGVHHTIAGNPSRKDRGRVALHVDDEWKRSLPRPQRILVLVATWPMLVRYGYLRLPHIERPR